MYRSDAGQAAVEQLDKNSDGAIAGSECDASPGLKSALPRIDYDHDGSVTAIEINRAVNAWRESRVAAMPVMAVVSLDGHPADDVTVTLEPEPFLCESSQPAYGKTDSDGFASLNSTNSRARGVALGWYRISVSKVSGDRESIAERFNAKTELGLEVTPESAMSLQHVVVNVRSR